MLGDELAAVLDELLRAFLLKSLVVPGAGEEDFHSDGGDDGADAQEPCGVAGLDLGVAHRADIADLGFLSGEVAVVDHFLELHTGSDTGEVAALEDGGEGIVVVVETGAVGLIAGAGGKLYLGVLLSGLEHVVLMTVAVGENDRAARVGKLARGVICLGILGDTGLDEGFRAGGLAGGLERVYEVEVIGGVLVVEADKTDLDGGRLLGGGLLSGGGIFFGGGSGSSRAATGAQC